MGLPDSKKELIRMKYYEFVNNYVVNYLYNEHIDTGPTQFDIYSYKYYKPGTIRSNLEHIIPLSYFKWRDAKVPIIDMMTQLPFYYDPFIMAPSQTKLNYLRKNFLYNDIHDIDRDFIVTPQYIILKQRDCANETKITDLFLERQYPTQDSIIKYVVFNKETPDKKVNITKPLQDIINDDGIILSGSFCGFKSNDTLCKTCFIEPNDFAKGDIARTILMYYVMDWETIKKSNKDPFTIHLTKCLKTYVDWCNKFTVSPNERTKHKNLMYITGLCNPFIEYFSTTKKTNRFTKEFIEHLFLGKHKDTHFIHLVMLQNINLTHIIPSHTLFDKNYLILYFSQMNNT